MYPITVEAGTDIITQGDTDATQFYVLEDGFAEVYKVEEGETEPKKVFQYSPPSAFGDLALFYSAPRAATVRAT